MGGNILDVLVNVVESLGVFGTSGINLDYVEYYQIEAGCKMLDLRGVSCETERFGWKAITSYEGSWSKLKESSKWRDILGVVYNHKMCCFWMA